MSSRSECRIYVGNLPPDIRTKDIQDLFYKFGKVTFVDLKNRRGPPFAFVEFEDPRDAEDAVHARDGYDYDGYRLRVEFPRGGGPSGFRGGRGNGGNGMGRGRGPPARRSQYRVLVTGRVIASQLPMRSVLPSKCERRVGKEDLNSTHVTENVMSVKMLPLPATFRIPIRKDRKRKASVVPMNKTGLPPSGSWQDLKDHMREAGDVCFADVYKDGTGVVEFLRFDDMKYAFKKLDDSRFRSHEGETSYIRVKEDYNGSGGGRDSVERGGSAGRGHSRSRSYSPRRRGSPTYSPVRRTYSRSRSRSRS